MKEFQAHLRVLYMDLQQVNVGGFTSFLSKLSIPDLPHDFRDPLEQPFQALEIQEAIKTLKLGKRSVP